MKRKVSSLAAMIAAVLLLSCSGKSDQDSQAQRSDTESQAHSSTPTVVLSIDGDDSVTVDGTPCQISDLSETLTKVAAEDPQHMVIRIVAADSLDVGILDKVEEQMRAAKLMRVVYAKGAGGGVPLVLPPPEYSQEMLQQIQGNLVTVHVEPEGAVLVDEKSIAMDGLQSEVQRLLEKNADLVVSVKTQAGTTYGSLIEALEQLKAAGASRITVNDPNL